MPDRHLLQDRPTTRDAIADKLMKLIATDVIHVGEALPGERELANAFNVSRESVRGAIRHLAALGVLEVAQGSRSRVLPFDLNSLPVRITAAGAIDSYDLESVHAARLLIELHVVGEAAARMDDATLGEIERLLAAQQGIGSDVTRFLICDREFHVAIYRACGNPLLADFVTDLYAYMIDHRRQAMAEPGAITASLADHHAIVEALRERDRDATVAAFHDHLMRIHNTTRRIQQRRSGKPANEN